MVRQVAALIGGEEQYNWFPVAVRSVYRESGPLGFFQVSVRGRPAGSNNFLFA